MGARKPEVPRQIRGVAGGLRRLMYPPHVGIQRLLAGGRVIAELTMMPAHSGRLSCCSVDGEWLRLGLVRQRVLHFHMVGERCLLEERRRTQLTIVGGPLVPAPMGIEIVPPPELSSALNPINLVQAFETHSRKHKNIHV